MIKKRDAHHEVKKSGLGLVCRWDEHSGLLGASRFVHVQTERGHMLPVGSKMVRSRLVCSLHTSQERDTRREEVHRGHVWHQREAKSEVSAGFTTKSVK